MEQQVAQNIYLDRLTALLAAIFAVVATVLASIGLYGLMSWNVVQRTRELGVRLALGASPRALNLMVMTGVTKIFLAGAAAGTILAYIVGRLAEAMLFGLSADTTTVYLAGFVVLALVSLAAGIVPARRAASIDPMVAIRSE
jgi:ABC-type antimicrobial peptide transport system permease subunit